MGDGDFEGTLVLEQLSEIGKIDEFYEAIDADDFHRAKALMQAAGLNFETIEMVLKKMADGGEGSH